MKYPNQLKLHNTRTRSCVFQGAGGVRFSLLSPSPARALRSTESFFVKARVPGKTA